MYTVSVKSQQNRIQNKHFNFTRAPGPCIRLAYLNSCWFVYALFWSLLLVKFMSSEELVYIHRKLNCLYLWFDARKFAYCKKQEGRSNSRLTTRVWCRCLKNDLPPCLLRMTSSAYMNQSSVGIWFWIWAFKLNYNF